MTPINQYLSGNVRDKLRFAELADDPRTEGNGKALQAVQPEDLVAEEIDVTLGTPWIPAEDVRRFLVETIGIAPSSVGVEYVQKERCGRSGRPVATAPPRRRSASTAPRTSMPSLW